MVKARVATGRLVAAAVMIAGLLVTVGCAGPGLPGAESAAPTKVTPSPKVAPSTGPTGPTGPVPEPEPGPAPVASELAMEWAEARLARMSPAEKVRSLFFLHVPGTEAGAMRAFVQEHRPGGMILMGDNIPADPGALAALTEAVDPDPELPLLFAIDQEGGVVSRLDQDTAPGADELKHLPASETRAAFRSRATHLREAGIQINFGIVADVSADPSSFIYDRVLGVDPKAAAERVAQSVYGESGIVLSCLKHFPGHGAGAGDSHQAIPQTSLDRDHWRAGDGRPFAAGIVAGAELVMLGHLEYSAIDVQPASLSPVWHSILRDDLGFGGIIISDDMLMLQDSGIDEYLDPSENAIRALAAGTTALLYVLPSDPNTVGIDLKAMVSDIATAIEAGRIESSQIDDAARALLVMRRTPVEESLL